MPHCLEERSSLDPARGCRHGERGELMEQPLPPAVGVVEELFSFPSGVASGASFHLCAIVV